MAGHQFRDKVGGFACWYRKKYVNKKQQDGPDLHAYGSSQLLETLFKHDLVDELWLKIFPLALGSGKRLFGDGTIPAAFKLARSEATPRDVIFACYERAGEVRTGSMGG